MPQILKCCSILCASVLVALWSRTFPLALRLLLHLREPLLHRWHVEVVVQRVTICGARGDHEIGCLIHARRVAALSTLVHLDLSMKALCHLLGFASSFNHDEIFCNALSCWCIPGIPRPRLDPLLAAMPQILNGQIRSILSRVVVAVQGPSWKMPGSGKNREFRVL